MEYTQEGYPICAGCQKPLDPKEVPECMYDRSLNLAFHLLQEPAAVMSIDEMPCLNKFVFQHAKMVCANRKETSKLVRKLQPVP